MSSTPDTIKVSQMTVDNIAPQSGDIIYVATGTPGNYVSRQMTMTTAGLAGLTNQGVLFANSSGNISQNSGFSYNTSTGALTIGSNVFIIGNSVTFSGNFTTLINVSGNTNVTLPTSGTLVNSAVATLSNLSSIGTITTGTWQGSVVAGQYGGTGVNNSGLTINLSSGATGKVLASDSSGNATWQALSGIGVTTLTGTANEVLVNGTSGSATSGAITLTTPQPIGTGSSPQFAGLNLTGLTASYAVVTDGSKNLSSIQYTSSNITSTIVSRDTNGNAYFNNVGLATATFSVGSIILTVATARYITLSSSASGVTLPDATTLINGTLFQINNNTSSTVTINKNGGALLTNLLAGSYVNIYLLDNSTSAGSWDYHFIVPANVAWGTASLTVPSTTYISAGQYNLTGTSSGTISIIPQASAGTYNFNLPTTAGTSGYYLTSGGGSSSPMTWTNPATSLVQSISATAPITASASTGNVTIAINNATTTTVGAASFPSTYFSVSSGAVTPNNFTITAGTGLSGGGAITLGGSTTISLSTPVSSTNGGTGVSNPTAHTFAIAEGSSAFNFLGPLTNGQILIGSTGADPIPATLTAGLNITITNNAGSITIAANATSTSFATNDTFSYTYFGGL